MVLPYWRIKFAAKHLAISLAVYGLVRAIGWTHPVRVQLGLRSRSFLLGTIFRTLGWNESPFNIFPAKGRYMWRDLERVCAPEAFR